MLNGAKKVGEIPKNSDPKSQDTKTSTQRDYTDYEEIK